MSKATGPAVPRIVLTPGEPAGIGPDLAVMLAQRDWPFELVVAADPAMLAARARALGLPLNISSYRREIDPQPAIAGRMLVCECPLVTEVRPGQLEVANAPPLLTALDRACDGCLSGEFAALVTGPLHKGVINDAGIEFSGHTEYLAARCGAALPVMLLVAGTLRVALATTHLPLAAVPAAITGERLLATLRVLADGLRQRFAIDEPRIRVLGLNPHAGESGHLGREELDVIAPALAAARAEGMRLEGPLSADTAFTPPRLEQADAFLAMYHDQGLPVLKHVGFGRAVNVTLGLPIVRCSVDHGTALQLAGTGTADAGSLLAALELASRMAGIRP